MVALGVFGSLVVVSRAPLSAVAGEPARTGAACPGSGFDESLRSLATARGKLAGTAYRSEFATGDPCYDRVAVREFNSLTPEIATFSNRIAAVEGRDDFSDADSICRLAQRHRMACQVQNLVWDPVDHPEWGIVPAWMKAQPPEQRRTTLIRYVGRVVRHFAGRADSFTVVNEAFDDSGHLRPSTWNTTGDDSYIFAAFRAARLADPGGRLYYNDFGAEGLNAKSDAIFNLVQRLRRWRVAVKVGGHTVRLPLIDGVGLQMHVGLGASQAPDPASVAANIDRLGRVGLQVRITEMDVRVPTLNGVASVADLRAQQRLYRRLVQTCLRASNCDGVTFWGFTDKHSWITENQSAFAGQGAAHPFDERYDPKPAYRGIRRALRRK
jgi:endo-1,4-beta-xylanase